MRVPLIPALKQFATALKEEPPGQDILIVVPPSVQPQLARWLLGQGLELYPVIAEDDTLPVFGMFRS